MKYITLLLIAFIINGCGKGESVDGFPHVLIGQWRIGCEKYDDDKFAKTFLTATEDSLIKEMEVFDDSECERALWSSQTTSSYTAEPGDEDEFLVDAILKQFTIKIVSEDVIELFNDETVENPGLCGVTNFKINETYKLTNRCYPETTDRLTYSFFKFEDQYLMFGEGDDEHDGLTEKHRFSKLSDTKYSRK